MNFLKRTSTIAVGTAVVGGALLVAIATAELSLVATYAATGALLLALIGITVNTYRNATPDRTMGRLLHDPEPAQTTRGARNVSAAPRPGAR